MKEKKERIGTEPMFEEIMKDNFLELMKNNSPQLQQA